jgi:hypothetical protein
MVAAVGSAIPANGFFGKGNNRPVKRKAGEIQPSSSSSPSESPRRKNHAVAAAGGVVKPGHANKASSSPMVTRSRRGVPIDVPTKSTPPPTKSTVPSDDPRASSSGSDSDDDGFALPPLPAHLKAQLGKLPASPTKMPQFGRYPSADMLPVFDSVLCSLASRLGPSDGGGGAEEGKGEEEYHECLSGLEKHEREVRATLKRTVGEGEGNCMLLIGPTGVGKTAASPISPGHFFTGLSLILY